MWVDLEVDAETQRALYARLDARGLNLEAWLASKIRELVEWEPVQPERGAPWPWRNPMFRGSPGRFTAPELNDLRTVYWSGTGRKEGDG